MENLGSSIVDVLRYQRDNSIDGNAYKGCQCDFAYNSNHIEGSTLTHDQTVQIFDRGSFTGSAKVDDIIEARNHFDAFDLILDTYAEPLCDEYLFALHRQLKKGTSDADNPLMSIGAYKKVSNVISSGLTGIETAKPHEVADKVDELLRSYEGNGRADLGDLAAFHHRFESIHPFSDGNGRVGRLLLFKECLRNDLIPLIVTEDLREFYIRGLREFDREPGYLVDTLGFAQDRFEAAYIPMIAEFQDAMAKEGIASSEQGSHPKR